MVLEKLYDIAKKFLLPMKMLLRYHHKNRVEIILKITSIDRILTSFHYSIHLVPIFISASQCLPISISILRIRKNRFEFTIMLLYSIKGWTKEKCYRWCRILYHNLFTLLKITTELLWYLMLYLKNHFRRGSILESAKVTWRTFIAETINCMAKKPGH